MANLISIFGLFVILGIGYAFSTARHAIRWKTIAWGLSIQGSLAFFILRTDVGKRLFQTLGDGITKLLDFSKVGSGFVFGSLVSDIPKNGFIFAFQVLPTIVFMASLISILYYLGIIQKIVSVVAKAMMKTMGTSGAESLSAVACVFVGQVEGPLLIKPYIGKMTTSELMAIMTGGMATIAGGVMAAYIGMGIPASHLLAASIMGAPAGLIMAKLLVPETEVSQTAGGVTIVVENHEANVIEAAAKGAIEGMHLGFVVAAMLIAFIALIAMVNGGLSLLGTSMESLFGYVFAPLAFVMGVPSQDMVTIGAMLGKKIALNEFVAYSELSQIIAGKSSVHLEPRSITIATFALCGFANFSSIAMNVGGIGALAPERRGELAKLGMKAMFAGALASCLTATIAGILS
jgi:CNT family concentrative nucleoside transporter